MTTKQFQGSVFAPDGALYVALTDGAGGLVSLSAGAGAGGTNGQIQYNNAGSFAGLTISGDGTLNTGTGVLTVTKTNGVAFGSFATGTDAANLTGTVSVNRFNSGTGATTSTFLRGDGTWVTPTASLSNFSSDGTTFSGSAQTITTSAPIINLTQTWNAGAVAFTAALINVTNTASASTSKLLDLQVGGTSMFSVNKSGALTLPNGSAGSPSLVIGNAGLYRGTVSGRPCSNNDFGSDGDFITASAGVFRWGNSTTGGTNQANTVAGIDMVSTGIVRANTGGTSLTNGTFQAARFRHPGVAYASLLASPSEGDVQFVTDSTVSTAGSTIAGGGANKVWAGYRGGNWIVIA